MKMRIQALVVILFCSVPLVQAQILPRKGSLGARLEAVAEGKGARVVEVLPNTTAASMGLQAGDVVKTVDDKAISTTAELVGHIRSWRANDPVMLVVERKGSTRRLQGRVVGKPLETSAHGTVIYGTVPFDGGLLRSILVLPTGVKDPPVVLMLPGVGCYSQDYHATPRSPFKQVVEDLVAQGIAVYRVEKPGVGDSRSNTPCEEMDFAHEVAAYRAALVALRGLPGIDKERIHLYGHSMGVLTAPMVMDSVPVAGIIAWGGISTSWFEYELRLIREQQAWHGKDPVEIERDLRAKLPMLYEFHVRKRTPAELALDPMYSHVLPDHYSNGLWHGLQHYSFFHGIADVDVLAGYRRANCPVLAVAGEYDLHTIDTSWAADITDAVNAVRPGTATAVIIPRTTHHYHSAPSMADYIAMNDAGELDDAYMADHYVPAVAQVIGSWVLGSK